MTRQNVERGYLDSNGRWHPEVDEESPKNMGNSSFKETFQDIGANFVENVTGAAAQGVAESVYISFRSQITPQVHVDMHDFVGGEDRTPQDLPPGPFGQASDWFLRNIVKPEVEVSILGSKRTIAPYGRPDRDYTAAFWLTVAAGLGGAAYLGYKAISKLRKG